MKKTTLRSLLCLVLVVLLAAAALTLTGCSRNPSQSATESDEAEAPASASDETELGTGEKTIYFDVTDKDGNTSSYAIHTDAATVGEALLENKLIEGEQSEYGLYVTSVLGQTLDWDADQMYWAFYEGGEYAMTGVDQTEITDGASYAFVATAG